MNSEELILVVLSSNEKFYTIRELAWQIRQLVLDPPNEESLAKVCDVLTQSGTLIRAIDEETALHVFQISKSKRKKIRGDA